MAEPVVRAVEKVGSEQGATGAQKHNTAVEVLSKRLAERVNDNVALPAMIEAYTDDALSFAVEGVVHMFNAHVGKAWGTHLNLSQSGDKSRLELEISF